MDNLQNKVVVITGASSGLGKAVALELAKKGAHLVLAARSEETLDAVARECCVKPGAKATSIPTDVTKVEDVENLACAALQKFGRVDIWINDAGVGAFGRFDEVPLEAHIKVLDTILNGVTAGSYYALQHFRKQGYGVLINVAALMGKVPTPLYASYVAANHGVVGLGAALRQELSIDKLDYVIRVCTLLCPTVNTPFFEHVANYSGKDPAKIAPVYEPEKVVEKILSLCTHPDMKPPWECKHRQ